MTAYYWSSFKRNTDFDHFIIKSIATSFIIQTIADNLFYNFQWIIDDVTKKTLFLIFASAIAGILIGSITTGRWFNYLLHLLHIGRTTNDNIWDDVIKCPCALRIYMSDGTSYRGFFTYSQPHKDEPIIALERYQLINKDHDIILDYSKTKDYVIMLQTKDFTKIEIEYYDSPLMAKVKRHFNIGHKD